MDWMYVWVFFSCGPDGFHVLRLGVIDRPLDVCFYFFNRPVFGRVQMLQSSMSNGISKSPASGCHTILLISLSVASTMLAS